MEYRRLGKTDIKISAIIMGTWQAGKVGWPGTDDAETTKAIKTAYQSGITTFDTASAYGKGHSERILGKALADVRDKVVLATKVVPQRLQFSQVIQSCHTSLQNLGTDYIDLFQIHWPAGSFSSKKVPFEETLKGLLRLKKEGKIRAFGVSNFSRPQLEAAVQCGRIDSLQPPYSLFWRQVEKDSIPFCVKNEISILAYASLAQGLLSGKYQPDHQFEAGDNRVGNKLFQPAHTQRIKTALQKLGQIAEARNVTLGQLSLAWLIAQPSTAAIVGARNSQQVLQNAEAAVVKLSETDLTDIDRIGRTVTDYLDDDPVLWN